MKKQIPKSILYVCTGNTCRSPMAEYITRELAKQKGLELIIGSRGTMAQVLNSFKLGATRDACDAALQLFPKSKIYLHDPSPLKIKDLIEFDLILTMQDSQRKRIISEAKEFFPGLENKVFSIREYVGDFPENPKDSADVEDPIGGGLYGADEDYSENKYVVCSKDLNNYIKDILNGKVLPAKKIFEIRKERKEKGEIIDWEPLLLEIKKAKPGEKIELLDSEYKRIEQRREGKIYDKPYLNGIVGKIIKTANSKKVKLIKTEPVVVQTKAEDVRMVDGGGNPIKQDHNGLTDKEGNIIVVDGDWVVAPGED